MGKWRLLVLALIHLIIIIHVLQWLYQGVTLSPVEPSEAMYTLESGELNAGFIMFLLAIVSTLLFGRFFCGWGCHVVALQDACTALMNRIGVRPKPFRSRLLVWSGLLLALYMFVWPTFKREALSPLAGAKGERIAQWIAADVLKAPAMAAYFQDLPRGFPYLLGPDAPYPGLRNALMVEDFWATFPPWYIAIPFLAICGFATVYFLGNKGFCTYGCPYGGFFAPVDRISLGRIVVSNACEGCGHCTAVCTSNVRVHQEVRDFGMVVDPGCMKCMDCVSACPNDALSFSFAKPAALVAPRTLHAKQAHAKGTVRRPEYDLSPFEECAVFGLAFVLLLSFRGMLNQVPLLMAVAMAAIGAFCGWTLWRMLRVANVRLQSLQLKTKGTITRAGWVFAVTTVAYFALAAWSGTVRVNRAIGDYFDTLVTTSQAVVFSPRYRPSEADQAAAMRAISFLERGGPRDLGGLGWEHSPAALTRLAWLWAVSGDLSKAEAYAQRAARLGRPGPALVSGLGTIMRAKGRSVQEYEAFFKDLTQSRTDVHHAHVALGNLYLGNNRIDDAIAQFDAVTGDIRRADDEALVAALGGMARAGKVEDVLALMPEVLRLKPNSAGLRSLRGALAMIDNKPDEAATWFEDAIKRAPRSPATYMQLAQLYIAQGKLDNARDVLERLNTVYRKLEQPLNIMPPDARIRQMMGG